MFPFLKVSIFWGLLWTPVLNPTTGLEGGAPGIAQIIPAENASEVSTEGPIVVRFTKEIDPRALNPETFFVEGAAGTVQYDPATRSATWVPLFPLSPSKTYTVTLSDEIQDLEGRRLSFSFTWSFTTRSAPETLLTIRRVHPPPNASHTPVRTDIEVTFSREIDPLSLRPEAILVTEREKVEGTLRYDRETRTAIFSPSSPLAYGRRYTVTVTGKIKDGAGNTLLSGESWSFTTEEAPSPLSSLFP